MKINLPKDLMPEELRGRVVKKNGVLYISATSFTEWASCSYRGYLSKIRKLVPVGYVDAALMFGIAIHECMADYLRTGKVKDFENYWLKFQNHTMYYTDTEQGFDNLMDKGKTIIPKMIALLGNLNAGRPYVTDDEKQTVEIQNSAKITSKIHISRTFDAILPVGGIPTLIDFKTASKMYTNGNQDEVSEQLTAYSLPHTISRVPQIEQTMFIVGTKTQYPTVAAFPTVRSPERIKQFKEDVIAIAKMIENRLYFRNRDFMCRYCPYYAICYLPKEQWKDKYRVKDD